MSEPGSRARPEYVRPRPPAWEAVLVGTSFLLVAGSLSWWASLTPEGSASRTTVGAGRLRDYVGNRACHGCHPGEYAHHRRSGHARTLRRAASGGLARRLDGSTAEDPERPGVTWSYSLQDGRLTAERSERGDLKTFFLEYAFGSGRHATTFLTLVDRDPAHPRGFEHRLTVFAHAEGTGLGLTPGQSLSGHASGNTTDGRMHTTDDTLHCFTCHTTATSGRGPDVLDTATMIPNIGCERCHGPGRAHVEAARRGAGADQLAMLLGPGRQTAAEQVERCGRCHRLPAMVRPGSIRTDNPVLVRHQPVGLLQSACYRRSEGSLSCTTCHDPHARASTDRNGYEAACLSCHEQPSRASCPVSPRSGCLDCHMPRRDVARGMLMTDHWIRIIPELDPRRQPRP